MVFRKLMAAFGAGVEVDTVLSNATVRPGEALRGVVNFKSGGSDYKVDGITIDLTAVVEVESGDSEYKTTYSFLRQQVAGSFQLAAGASHSQPFEIPVPWETPISAIGGHPLHGMRLGVQTELALAGALDKGDLDPLYVTPLPAQEHVIAALDRWASASRRPTWSGARCTARRCRSSRRSSTTRAVSGAATSTSWS